MGLKDKQSSVELKHKKHEDEVELSDQEEVNGVETDPVEIMNSFSVPQRRRIYALKGYLKEYRTLAAKFRERIAALELAHLKELEPLFEERRKIVTGEQDINEEEENAAKASIQQESRVEELDSDEEGSGEKKQSKKVQVVSKSDEKVKDTLEEAAQNPNGGIPGFWLNVLKHSEVFGSEVTDRDTPALMHLKDIKKEFLNDKPRDGFVLNFYFNENPYFTNSVLKKTYFWDKDDNDSEDPLLERIEGTEIDWKSQENKLTVILKQKKQRHKKGKGVRVVTCEEECPSFFHFFKTPKNDEESGDDEDPSDEEDDVYEEMEADYDFAIALDQDIIPRAAYYYTAKNFEDALKEREEIRKALCGDGSDNSEEEDGDEQKKIASSEKKDGNDQEKECKQQ